MMSCGGRGLVEGCVGALLACLRFTHPIWGQQQKRELLLREAPGERLALTVQHRRMMAAAPTSSTGSSRTYCSERAEHDQHNIRSTHFAVRSGDTDVKAIYVQEMCGLIKKDTGTVANPMSLWESWQHGAPPLHQTHPPKVRSTCRQTSEVISIWIRYRKPHMRLFIL